MFVDAQISIISINSSYQSRKVYSFCLHVNNSLSACLFVNDAAKPLCKRDSFKVMLINIVNLFFNISFSFVNPMQITTRKIKHNNNND
ncbi:hypothetical protein DERP_005825 [Dermatophagoides pteronyssinus]|uniref:Uncharacterized protein n=1 Tax=Dermatophagoides pteronyssinus TaxID=6956 RepID=A0ABQ8J9N0_DERPT|nr:hypothetical protein DERP_005825 [Dermatophagoides pteronyssinus]